MKLPYGKRLTVKMITEAKAADGKDEYLWDGEIHGFGVRIRPSGVKSFVFQYRTHGGTERRVTIEKVGAMTLEDARERARKLKGTVADGGDPKATRDAARNAPTVDELAEAYLTRYAERRKRSSSIENDRAMLRDYIRPALGAKKVAAITRDDLERLHHGMKEKPYRANRVLALLSKMMNLAVEWGWRTDNPARKIERYPEVARERFLSPEEVKRLADALHAHPNRDGVNATWLLLFTGSRKSEVLGAKWQEFDLERGIWTKPAHRTKQKKVEHFPLSNDALSILRAMRSAAPEDATWLFPGGDETRPYGGFRRFWKDLCKEANLVGFRVHDCRHDFASTLVQQGYSLPAIGKLLGHTNPSTTNRYAHHNLDELRKVSDAAANRFTVIIGGKAKEEPPLPLPASA